MNPDQIAALQTLRVERTTSGVAHVAMAREQVLNAFDEQMIDEIEQSFRLLGADPQVRVIVLSGQGRMFSAGADLQWMKRASEASHHANLADARRFAAMLQRIAESPKPTIARIHGLAMAGGVGLACACDIAVASDDAQFSVGEVRLGILPSVIAPYLVNAVGRRQAMRLALTASRIGAAEALAIGLLHRVVPLAELDAAVDQFVADLLANGPIAVGEAKKLIAQLAVGPISAEVRELTAQTISRVRMTDEAREGFAAFLQKRPPAWNAR